MGRVKMSKLVEKLMQDIYLSDNMWVYLIDRLIENKTNELVTDTMYVFDNYLEEFKTTIKKDDRKYIVEKTGDNYTVTYINSSINDIEESYYTINDKIDYVKKLERKKTF